jgi:hypothetical protein
MVAGYFAESLVRRRLRRSSYDAVETPLLLVAISLSGAMAALGRGGVQQGIGRRTG